VDVKATSLLGIQFRPQLTPLSDITASSRFGVSGTVIINNLTLDPASGLVELPDETSDPSDQVAIGCAADEGNSFTLTGRGGLPEDPTAAIRGQTVWVDLQDWSAAEETSQTAPESSSQAQSDDSPLPVREARGWIVNASGNVELVAALPKNQIALPPRSRLPQCSEFRARY
jgi:large exoprotein involved in heme utilization and adhesion